MYKGDAMRTIRVLGIAAVTAIFFLALSTGSAYALLYLGTFSGNDNDLSQVEAYVESKLGYDISLQFYAKVDKPGTADGGLSVTYGSGNLTGTWATGDPISLFSVKGSNGYALYWLEPGDDLISGEWSTDKLLNNGGQQPAISHFSTWTTTGGTNPPGDPVPEPATLLFVGAGLAGLGAWRSKKYRK